MILGTNIAIYRIMTREDIDESIMIPCEIIEDRVY